MGDNVVEQVYFMLTGNFFQSAEMGVGDNWRTFMQLWVAGHGYC